jgi:alpha-glucosidase
LPVPEEHRARAVAQQQIDPHSVLNGFRAFMRWRRAHPALCWGSIEFLDTAEPVLAFVRRFEAEALLVVFNLGVSATALTLPPLPGVPIAIDGHGLQAGTLRHGDLHLPGHGAWFARLD